MEQKYTNLFVFTIVGILWLAAAILIALYAVQRANDGNNTGSWTAQEQKEPDIRYTERLPTEESKQAVREQEEALRKQIKEETEKSLALSGITSDMKLYDIEMLRSTVGSEVIDKYFNKNLWQLEDGETAREVSVKRMEKFNDFEATLSFRIKNFVLDAPLLSDKNGDIVAYKIDKDGKKTDIVDLSKEKEILEIEKKYARGDIETYPEDIPERDTVSQEISFVYKNIWTDVYITISGKNEEEVKERLDGAVRIGMEVRSPYWIPSLHTNPLTFDFSVPVIIK